MPPGLDSIVCSIIILCDQTLASHAFIRTLKKSGDKSGWHDRNVLLSEWKTLNFNFDGKLTITNINKHLYFKQIYQHR